MHVHGEVSSLLDMVHLLQLSWLQSLGAGCLFPGRVYMPLIYPLLEV